MRQRLLRGARVVGLGVAGALAGAFLMVLPLLPRAAPLEIYLFVRDPLWRILALALLLVCGPRRLFAALPQRVRRALAGWTGPLQRRPRITHAAHRLRDAGRRLDAHFRRRLAPLDAAATRAMGAPASTLAVLVSGLFLLTWIPHYLTWPWWPDVDQFAVSAQFWSVGVLPYRDLADFDFPGPIYQHYLLGKAFGWGATVAFQALDAMTVVAFGVALAAWSRRMFGSVFPGLVSYLSFLVMYLSFDYSLICQRDWSAPLLVVLGLFALEVWPGRWARPIAALAMGLALSYRPHEIVFLPAMAAAVDEARLRAGEPWRRALRPLLEWAAWLAVGVLLAFSPLILGGILDDLVRCLLSGERGHYNVRTWYSFTHGLLDYLHDPATMGVLAVAIALALGGPEPLRLPARTWALALLGVFFYKPMAPWPHYYLNQPIALIWMINLAIIVAWLRTTPRLVPAVRLAAIGLLLVSCVPGGPTFCSVSASLRALGPLWRGTYPIEQPPGCIRNFADAQCPSDHYRWADYTAVLTYLRESTSPDTRVADLLWNVPYPPVNGPAGRLTPFPAAGGYIHLWMVDPSLIDEYVAILKKETDVLVVWGPGKGNPFFPALDRAVFTAYRPVTRFGDIQVWRHKRAGARKTARGEITARTE